MQATSRHTATFFRTALYVGCLVLGLGISADSAVAEEIDPPVVYCMTYSAIDGPTDFFSSPADALSDFSFSMAEAAVLNGGDHSLRFEAAATQALVATEVARDETKAVFQAADDIGLTSRFWFLRHEEGWTLDALVVALPDSFCQQIPEQEAVEGS